MNLVRQLLTWLRRLLRADAPAATLDQLSELARKIEPCATIESLPLAESQKLILKEISRGVANNPRQRASESIVLLIGNDPLAKTNAAEVVASGLQRNLYRIDSTRVVSKYIGETEKNLQRVFRAAEQGDAILFFDEAEALFVKRGEVKDAHDRYSNLQIASLLQRLETFQGLAILATNNAEDTPESFRRRVRFLVNFPV